MRAGRWVKDVAFLKVNVQLVQRVFDGLLVRSLLLTEFVALVDNKHYPYGLVDFAVCPVCVCETKLLAKILLSGQYLNFLMADNICHHVSFFPHFRV